VALQPSVRASAGAGVGGCGRVAAAHLALQLVDIHGGLLLRRRSRHFRRETAGDLRTEAPSREEAVGARAAAGRARARRQQSARLRLFVELGVDLRDRGGEVVVGEALPSQTLLRREGGVPGVAEAPSPRRRQDAVVERSQLHAAIESTLDHRLVVALALEAIAQLPARCHAEVEGLDGVRQRGCVGLLAFERLLLRHGQHQPDVEILVGDERHRQGCPIRAVEVHLDGRLAVDDRQTRDLSHASGASGCWARDGGYASPSSNMASRSWRE
jgi:hypothetical protein